MAITGDNYITLRWLNTQGGWDQWTFGARHTYGYNIGDVKTFERNIFSDWDTTFGSGKVSTELLMLNASKKLTLRSGFLNKTRAEAVATIKFAKAIEIVKGAGMVVGQQVKVDRGSFDYRTDRDRQIDFSLVIELPKIQMQKG